jgi:hypothetical protein
MLSGFAREAEIIDDILEQMLYICIREGVEMSSY